jgi:hypothetical protein
MIYPLLLPLVKGERTDIYAPRIGKEGPPGEVFNFSSVLSVVHFLDYD